MWTKLILLLGLSISICVAYELCEWPTERLAKAQLGLRTAIVECEKIRVEYAPDSGYGGRALVGYLEGEDLRRFANCIEFEFDRPGIRPISDYTLDLKGPKGGGQIRLVDGWVYGISLSSRHDRNDWQEFWPTEKSRKACKQFFLKRFGEKKLKPF